MASGWDGDGGGGNGNGNGTQWKTKAKTEKRNTVRENTVTYRLIDTEKSEEWVCQMKRSKTTATRRTDPIEDEGPFLERYDRTR